MENLLDMMLSSNKTATMSNAKDLSEDVAEVFYVVNYAVLSTCVCIIGSIGNIFNMVVFAKQGFQITVNITFFAMAISDLASLVTLLFLAISFTHLQKAEGLSFYPIEVQVLFGGWPHIWFLRITAWLTAFISVERCVCIFFPLKVKVIFTPRKVKVIVVAIYVLVTASMAPTYYYTRLGWRFDPARNRSMLGLTFTPDRAKVENVSYLINSVLSPLGYFSIIVVSTATLVIGLNRKSKWRQRVTGTGMSDNDSNAKVASKDRRVIKMVVTIAAIFMIFLVPSSVVFLWQSVEPELYIMGELQNTFKAAASVTMMLEAVCSSVNILVYYNMSSSYRDTFRSLVFKKE